METRIRKIVKKYINKCGTNDPFEIAKKLDVVIQIGNLGSNRGYYMYLKKHKCVFLNEKLDSDTTKFVLAHELGHAIMHTKKICAFSHKDEYVDERECEADLFAMILLHDDMIARADQEH